MLLGIPYAYFVKYVPFIYLNFIATAGFGALVGIVAAMGARAGKLQSSPMYQLLGVVCGLVAVYSAWVFWIFALTGQGVLTFNPRGIYIVVCSYALCLAGLASGEYLCRTARTIGRTGTTLDRAGGSFANAGGTSATCRNVAGTRRVP